MTEKDILEIQTAHADLYGNEAKVFDDISMHEDPKGVLRSFLLGKFDFEGRTAYRICLFISGSGRKCSEGFIFSDCRSCEKAKSVCDTGMDICFL